MWWETQQVAGKKGLTGKETHPKKSCRGSKGPFHSYDKEKKKNYNYYKYTHTKKNKQINKRKTQDAMRKYFRNNTRFKME